MDDRLEAVVLSVSDPDRSKAFYEQCGFHLDVDHQPNDDFRVIQFTPPGSACSVTFGVKPIRHMTPDGWQDGPDPQHQSYNSFAEFVDPDGNGWLLQEVGHPGAVGTPGPPE